MKRGRLRDRTRICIVGAVCVCVSVACLLWAGQSAPTNPWPAIVWVVAYRKLARVPLALAMGMNRRAALGLFPYHAPHGPGQRDAPRGGDALQHGPFVGVQQHQQPLIFTCPFYIIHTSECSILRVWSQPRCAAPIAIAWRRRALRRRC